MVRDQDEYRSASAGAIAHRQGIMRPRDGGNKTDGRVAAGRTGPESARELSRTASVGRAALHKSQEKPEEKQGKKGQQHLLFVRRDVYCCSAVARGSLALPSPSLGVSSLDLGRSSNVSGPFSFSHYARFRRSRWPGDAIRRRPDTAAVPQAEFPPAGRPGSPVRQRGGRTRRSARSGVRPYRERD